MYPAAPFLPRAKTHSRPENGVNVKEPSVHHPLLQLREGLPRVLRENTDHALPRLLRLPIALVGATSIIFRCVENAQPYPENSMFDGENAVLCSGSHALFGRKHALRVEKMPICRRRLDGRKAGVSKEEAREPLRPEW